MKIYPIVEGHGEVEAVPVLLRRLLEEAKCFTIEVGRPIRRTQSQFRSRGTVQTAIKMTMNQPDCAAVLMLFDGEDDCPKHLAADVQNWANEAAAGRVPCGVVIAYREYETWFLAAMESLRGRYGIHHEALSPAEPEASRDAKSKLEEFMPFNRAYSETGDQPGMSDIFDMKAAYRRNRSFRKMVKTIGDLLRQLHQPIESWPPIGWNLE